MFCFLDGQTFAVICFLYSDSILLLFFQFANIFYTLSAVL